MNKSLLGSVALCIFMLALCAHPSAARLREGNFVPFSEVVSSTADRQLKLHRVVKGDTLSRIARRNNVQLKTLMLANNMNEKTILEIGSTVRIPACQGTVHVISPGDTIANLAERYQVSRVAMIEANQDKNPNSLEIGDCLHIPAADDNEWMEPSWSEPSRGNSLSNSMAWPIAGTISSAFGWRKSGFHHGLDIANEIGTPIHAAAAGTVSFVGYKSVYGRTVIIDHPDGKQTLYAHAKTICVDKGEKVSRGQVIASVGVSGVTTGPHVHFEVRIDNKAYNPLNFLRR